MWLILAWLTVGIGEACSVSCIAQPSSLPQMHQRDVPLDATIIIKADIDRGVLLYAPVDSFDDAEALKRLEPTHVGRMALFTPSEPLLPATDYQMIDELSGEIWRFRTGLELLVDRAPQPPTEIRSSFSQTTTNFLSRCGASTGKISEVTWQGDEVLYELNVQINDGTRSVLAEGHSVFLGDSHCIDNLPLDRGDFVELQIRSWHWDGTHSEWTDWETLDTGGCSGCKTSGGGSAPSLWLWLAGVVLAYRRREGQLGRTPN